jgi:hypothetical protein
MHTATSWITAVSPRKTRAASKPTAQAQALGGPFEWTDLHRFREPMLLPKRTLMFSHAGWSCLICFRFRL